MPKSSFIPATKNFLFFVLFILLALCPLSFISMTVNDIPRDDARQNVQAAAAYYVGVSDEDSREPLYPLLVSAVLKFLPDQNFKEKSWKCFNQENTCPDVILRTKGLNWLFHVLATVLAGLSVLYITERRGLALIAMAGISLNTVMISAVNNWLTEPQAVFFLLLHSVTLYSAVTGTSLRKSSAIISGIALGLLVLTKAVFLPLLYIYAFMAFTLFITARDKMKPLLLLCIAGFAVTFPFHKELKPVDAVDYNRGAAVMAIRAEYDTMPWSDVTPALLYFTPEIGPDLVKKKYGKETFDRFDRENENGYYGRVKHQQGAAYNLARKEKISLQDAALKIMRQNLEKHIALTPVFAWEGLFIPKKIAADNTHFQVVKIISKIVNILLLPFCLLAALWLLRNRYYTDLLLALPAIYSFAMHSVLTHYWPRYSVPLLAVGLVFACVAWHLRHEGKTGS